MLGFTSTRKPITGEVAREIREQLLRLSEGRLSDKDLEMKSKQQLTSQYTLVEK